MKAEVYEYAVIRYVPDVEREEFVNIGLLMMCKRRRWIQIHIELDAERMRHLRGCHAMEEIERQIGTFLSVARGEKRGGSLATLPVEERFRWLTAVKSACLQTSRPHPGLTHDLDDTFRRLLHRLVL